MTKIKYEKIYFEEISEDYIKTLLIDDGRFIFLNENQFMLRSKLKILISDNYYNIDLVEEYIKNEYFVRNIDRNVLLGFKQDSLQLKFGDRIYEICDINSFYESVREEGFISFDVANAVSEYLEVDYHALLREMKEINVRIDFDNEFEKQCVVVNRKKDNISNLEIIDNGENILLADFRSNELVAAITILYLIREDYMEGSYYFSDRHISGLYRMNIIEKYDKNQEIKLTNIGRNLIESFGIYLNEKIYIMDLLVDEVSLYESTKELAKSKTIKDLDNINLWKEISPSISQIYRHNEYSKLLMDLIYDGNNNGIYNLGDILLFHLQNEKREEIYKIFIGKKASSGIKPIKENKDICLKCKGHKCTRNTYITKTKLLYYRNNYVNEYIEELSRDLTNLDKILKDPLIIKFVVPYNLTSKNKVIMKKIDILDESSNILHKKDGKYCPFEDVWVLKEKYNDTLV